MMTKTTIRATAKRTQNVGLTRTKATTQARKIVDKVMPGAGATVDSRTSADPATLEATVVTTITFPRGHDSADLLFTTLNRSIIGTIRYADSSIVITRKVNP